MLNLKDEALDFTDNYQFFIENFDSLICIINPKDYNRINLINEQAYLDKLGYTHEDLLGESLDDFIYIDDIKQMKKFLLKKGELRKKSLEIRVKNKHGDNVWFELKVKTIRDSKNELYLLILLKDLSHQKRFEEELKESEDLIKKLTKKMSEIRFWDVFYPKKHEEALLSAYKMLENIIENIPQYIFWKDVSLMYQGCNMNYAKFIDFNDINSIIGKTDDDILWNNRIIRINREKEQFVINSNNAKYHNIETWKLKDGNEIWLDANRIPLRNSKEKVSGILVTYEDITHKILYENLIVQLNRNLLNFTTDIQNNIKILLNTCCELLKGDIALFIYKNIKNGNENYHIISSNNETYNVDSTEFKEKYFINEIFKAKHESPQILKNLSSTRYVTTDSFIKLYKINGCYGKLIKSEDDSYSSICILYRNELNIHQQEQFILNILCDALEKEQERWKAKQRLEEQNIKLNKIDLLKKELLSRTSHELKTPLISIKGYTDLLLDLFPPDIHPKLSSYLNHIKNGTNRLEKIITSLLTVSQLEHGKIRLNQKVENLSLLINQCVEDLNILAKSRNQSISTKIQDNIFIYLDKEKIYEVLSNLIMNAIKFTHQHGKIQIISNIKDKDCIISIKDNGLGITEEEEEKLFKRFGKIERFGHNWDVCIEGAGLGLYFSKQIIDLHNGKIWVESDGRYKGSTFYISLPIISN